MGSFSNALQGAFPTFHWDVAFGVMQDVDDTHGVAQFGQFESDNKVADRIRELVPDKHGGDDPEDYEFLMHYHAKRTELDINRYGGKGYALYILDQVGRGLLSGKDIEAHLGYSAKNTSLNQLWKELKHKYYPYILQVGSGTSGRRNFVTDWWENHTQDRVIICERVEWLHWYQLAIIYMTETANPHILGLSEVLNLGNSRLSQGDISCIWDSVSLIPSKSAEAKIAYPAINSKFAYYRDVWPVGHERASENPAVKADDKAIKPVTKRTSVDWSKF